MGCLLRRRALLGLLLGFFGLLLLRRVLAPERLQIQRQAVLAVLLAGRAQLGPLLLHLLPLGLDGLRQIVAAYRGCVSKWTKNYGKGLKGRRPLTSTSAGNWKE